MDTKLGLIVVLALASGQLAISMSGYGAHVGGTPAAGSQSAEKLNNTGPDGSGPGAPSQNGSVQGSSEDQSIVSMILSGGSNLVSVLKFLALLPVELARLDPVPWFAAWPAGITLQIYAGIGFWQFTAGRVYN